MLRGKDPSSWGPIRAIDIALHMGGVGGERGMRGQVRSGHQHLRPPVYAGSCLLGCNPGVSGSCSEHCSHTALWARVWEHPRTLTCRSGESRVQPAQPCALWGWAGVWFPLSGDLGVRLWGRRARELSAPASPPRGQRLCPPLGAVVLVTATPEPLTLMLQNWWFSEHISETCRAESRESGSLGVGGPGISQRSTCPCSLSNLTKRGLPFLSKPFQGVWGTFEGKHQWCASKLTRPQKKGPPKTNSWLLVLRFQM